jgi:hypothetical protein
MPKNVDWLNNQSLTQRANTSSLWGGVFAIFKEYLMNITTTSATQQATNAVNTMPSLKEGACLMSANATGSCGEAVLSKAATLLEGQTIDSELVKGTTLQWFPKDKLRFVNKTLQRIQRLFSTKGVSFGKGLTLIPLSLVDEVKIQLDSLKTEFEDEVNILINNFDEFIEQHKDANPDISDLIDKYKMEKDQFKGRFIFKSIPPMAVQPLFEDDEDELRGNITQTLFDEIANDAAKLAKGSFIGKELCSQKAVSAIRKIKTKLVNLAFLDDGIFSIVDSFDEALENLPKTGPITNGQFHRLANYVQVISSKENLHGLASGEISSTAPETEVEEDISQSLTEEEFETAADNLLQQTIETDENIVQVAPEDVVVTSAPTHAPKSMSVFDDELGFGGF